MTWALAGFLSRGEPGVGRVDQVEVGALPVPHLPPGIAGVRQDRRDRAQRPRGTSAVRIPLPGRKIAAMTQQLARVFQDGIARHPEDWHMLQKVFLADLDTGRLRATSQQPPPAG